MIRVLVADDSPTARALLVEILRGDPEIQVAGEARNGLEAVELAKELRPNVVTMDIRMPRMDGFTATKEIMMTAPTPIVIVTGSNEGREMELAVCALRAGAVTVLLKPPGPGVPAFAQSAEEFTATIKAMSQVRVVRHWPCRRHAEQPPWQARLREQRPLVAIAASTGGPAALEHLLSGLSGKFPAPILVVQHITRGFTSGLADWLNTVCELRVKVAEHGEPLAPRTVYFAPDDHHLGVSGHGSIILSDAPPVGGFRPSGSFLFESVARVFGRSVVAVILTGMGQDGVEGLRAIRQLGGRVVAQDEGSSVVFGMPAAAISAGLANAVLPPDKIAPWLIETICL